MTRKNVVILASALFVCVSSSAFAAPEGGKEKDVNTTSQVVNPNSFTSFSLGKVATTKINATFEVWNIQNQNTTPNDQHLRLRRSELKLTGNIAEGPKYFVMVDPARLIPPPGGKHFPVNWMVQDFGMTYPVLPGLDFTVGQFKLPSMAESLIPGVEFPLPERSLAERTIGNAREMGTKLGYKTRFWNVTSMLSCGRAIYGTGTGMLNDWMTRAELTPSKAFEMGGFAGMGNGFDYSKKGRWGVNARYSLGSAIVRAEYAHAKTGPIHSQGFTTELGYWITENLEPIVKYEYFRPQQGSTSAQAETVGVSYYFRKYFTRLQMAASNLQNLSAVNGSSVFADGAANKEITLAIQTAI